MVGGARNGFPFLPLHGCWSVSNWYGRALRTSTHRPIALTMLGDLCVTVLQVYGVGGANLHRMVDSRCGAFSTEMQGWAAVQWLHGVVQGTAELAQTVGHGLACSSGGGAVGEWGKGQLPVHERCPSSNA